MGDKGKIEVLKWLELSIANENNTLGTFEWPDISHLKRIGYDNEKDKGEMEGENTHKMMKQATVVTKN